MRYITKLNGREFYCGTFDEVLSENAVEGRYAAMFVAEEWSHEKEYSELLEKALASNIDFLAIFGKNAEVVYDKALQLLEDKIVNDNLPFPIAWEEVNLESEMDFFIFHYLSEYDDCRKWVVFIPNNDFFEKICEIFREKSEAWSCQNKLAENGV